MLIRARIIFCSIVGVFSLVINTVLVKEKSPQLLRAGHNVAHFDELFLSLHFKDRSATSNQLLVMTRQLRSDESARAQFGKIRQNSL